MRPVLAVPLVALPLLVPLAAHAQAIDMTKGGPVSVTSSEGMEWRQTEQVIIAKGEARAVRGDVTVTADQLVAHYRKKKGPAPVPGNAPAPAPAPAPSPPPGNAAGGGPADVGADAGNTEIFRLEAEGHVHIFTATDQATADRAVYDIDQAVLVLTGQDLRITTPQEVMTAHDAMEYWSQKRMAVGRGDAVVTTNDGRRLRADILVGYTTEPSAAAPAKAVAVVAKADKPADPLGAGGKLQRVDAFGHVEVRTATEIIHADKGVYVPDTGIARLAGSVRLTRGQNQLNGDEGMVNLKTGISTVTRHPGSRVEGLVVPSDRTGAPEPKPEPKKDSSK